MSTSAAQNVALEQETAWKLPPIVLVVLSVIALQDDPSDASARAEHWERLLSQHHAAIDVLVVWGREPRLDAINAHWFHPVAEDGSLRILRHR